MAPNNSIKLLSLNCWGLKYVSKHRLERIRAIADVLRNSDYDVVCLQELWVYSDYQLVRNATSKVLPYSKHFFSGALGSGLAIFTRFPIVEVSIRPYSLNGSPLDVAGGDFFVGKSIVSVVVDHPLLGETEIFNTHMYARGGDDGEEWNRAHRLVGAWQLASLIRASAKRGRYVIATGDLNSIPTSLAISVIQSHGGVTDAWNASHDSSLFPTDSVHNPQHALRDFGITADSPLNSFSGGKHLDGVARKWQGKRLDYVFYRAKEQVSASLSASTSSEEPGSFDLVCTSSQVTFTGRVPGYNFSFSDHFGLEATLEVRNPSRPGMTSATNGNFVTSSPSLRSTTGIPLANVTDLQAQNINATLAALSIAYRQARHRANVQLAGFLLALTTAAGLIVGSAWQPTPAFNPLMVLVAVALGWGGTTLLYSGFIHGNYETNMFVNAIEELELLRSAPQGRSSNSSEGSLRQ